MTIGTALFLALAVFIVGGFVFLLTIYLKEYNREEKTIQKLVEQQEKYNSSMMGGNMPVYVLDMPVQKKAKTSVDEKYIMPSPVDKNKKNVN